MTTHYLTQHARARMAERDITAPMVDAVLHSAEHENWTYDGKENLSLCGLTAVVSRDTGAVITVFADGSARCDLTPKRAAKMKSQRKRERERRQKRRQEW